MTLTVYSKKNCPACDKAKQFLMSKAVEFSEIKIDENLEARNFLLESGHRSVPQIYQDGKLFVNSVSELTEMAF